MLVFSTLKKCAVKCVVVGCDSNGDCYYYFETVLDVIGSLCDNPLQIEIHFFCSLIMVSLVVIFCFLLGS